MNEVGKDAGCFRVVERRRSQGGLIGGEDVGLVEVSCEGTKLTVVMVRRGHDQTQLVKAFGLRLIHHLLVGFHVVIVFGFVLHIYDLRLRRWNKLCRRVKL